MKPFGPHLMLDFYTPSRRLSDIWYWEDLLERLVAELPMRQLSDPVVIPTECDNPAWEPSHATGLSGFIVLAESHISFHTFVEAGYVFLDIFSCKHFSVGNVSTFLRNELGATNSGTISHLVRRGGNFPFSAESKPPQ